VGRPPVGWPHAPAVARLAGLEYSARVLDALSGALGTITLHVGGAHGNPEAAKARAAHAAASLSEGALARLTLEHDDTVFDLDLALAVLAGVEGDRPVDVMLEAKAKEAAVLRQQARLGRR
jgi:UV DNA damage repair endonuclease